MKTISRDHLQRLQGSDDDLTIVEVLGEDKFREYHLPGAINVPLGDDFAEDIQQAVPEKSSTVVVYCFDEECQASNKAGHKMDDLGYEHVYDYEAGKEDWKQAGLPIVE